VGTTNIGFEGVHGRFGYGDVNQEGKDILKYVVAYDILRANTFFRKRQKHLVTFSSAQNSSQIDFILTKTMDWRDLDCKVNPGECVATHHNLVVADFRFHAWVLEGRGAKS
jgi:hypothetical protein